MPATNFTVSCVKQRLQSYRKCSIGQFLRFLPLAAILAAQTEQPLVRVTTRLVEVNVIVRDKHGPVLNLTKDDFTLFDKGKEQKIAAFAVSTTRLAPQAKPEPLPPNVFSNHPEHRAAPVTSVTVVLLDGLNTQIQDQNYARQQFLKFLKQIRPDDRVAVYTLGATLRVLQDFTSDSAVLVKSVAKFTGDNMSQVDAGAPDRADTGDSNMDAMLNDAAGFVSDNANINRAQNTAAALEAIAHHIARLPGRKNLVWISGSFPFSIGLVGADGENNWESAAYDQYLARGGTARPGSGGPAEGSLNQVNLRDGNPARAQRTFEKDLQRATRAVNAANISIYPVDARGLIVLPKNMTAAQGPISRASVNDRPMPGMTIPVGHNTMQYIAEGTGGRVFENTNDIRMAIRTAIDDSEVTYTLGFYPDTKLDDTFHELKVQLKRKDVDLRFRRGYMASAQAQPSEQDRVAQIRDAVTSPIEATGIALMAELERDQPKPGSLRLTVAIEPKDLTLRQDQAGKWTGQIDLSYVQKAADGRLLKSDKQALGINLDAEKYRALMSQGFTITKSVEPLEGVAELRVVISDNPTGKLGSLSVPVKR